MLVNKMCMRIRMKQISEKLLLNKAIFNDMTTVFMMTYFFGFLLFY